MDENLYNIFQETDCISEEKMIAYFEKKLNSQEMRIVEMHLADCEICQDIYEGLALIPNKRKLLLIERELEKRILNRVKPKSKTLEIFSYRKIGWVAASFLFLIGLSLFMVFYTFHQQKQKLALNARTEKKLDSLDKGKEPLTETTLKQNGSDDNKKKGNAKVNQQKTKDNKGTIINSETINRTESISQNSDLVLSESEIYDSAEISETRGVIVADEILTDDFNQSEMAKKSVSRFFKTDQTVDDTKTLLQKGIDNYNNKEYDQALTFFNLVLNQKNSLEYDDAKWYKALIYSKKGKTKTAMRIFNEIISDGGKYKESAQKQIDLIKK